MVDVFIMPILKNGCDVFMNILSGLFISRDKPTNRTLGEVHIVFLGGTTSGKTVTERTAMQMTTVYSCIKIIGRKERDDVVIIMCLIDRYYHI
jgi:hypothetical protein